MMTLVANHVWQSTACGAIAAMVALALRQNRAQVRYGLWLAASVKFLVPFAALVALGSHAGWRPSSSIIRPELTVVMDAMNEPFSRSALPLAIPLPATSPLAASVPILLIGTWACGFTAILFAWATRWRHIAAAVKQGSPIEQGREIDTMRRLETISGIRRPIAVVSSTAPLEPGMFGILKPVLVWPHRIGERMTDGQIEAILTHELCHVRRRDNLAAAAHMVVEALFWFHPLVWWIGARLVDERERACDEQVIRLGSDPQVYAESILKTCEFYVESPLVCVAGVTGADLKKRMERIMKNDVGTALNTWRKSLVATAAVVAFVGPLAIGLINTPRARAQSPSSDAIGPPFPHVTVTLNTSGDPAMYPMTVADGRFALKNTTLRFLIFSTYLSTTLSRENWPTWLDSDRFDIEAQADSHLTREQMWPTMVRRLLADRFNLQVHTVTRVVPVYALTLANAGGALGPQLRLSACAGKGAPPPPGPPFDPPRLPQLPCGGSGTRPTGVMQARWHTMAEFAEHTLRGVVGRRVIDRTGLTGRFDLDVAFTPQPMGPRTTPAIQPPPSYDRPAPFVGPEFFTALEEQLGLRLASETGPVEFLVIDHVERPSEP
jgi:bla regulator protein BlaR1